MLTIIMECHDHEPELAQTLAVLVAGAVEGLVSDVIILDHGSQDGSSLVADAAGCRFLTQWNVPEVIHSARGEWLLLLEPGSRLQQGWIADIVEFIQLGRSAARFSPSKTYRRPLLQRLSRRPAALEHGLLLPKTHAVSLLKPGSPLSSVTRGLKLKTLRSQIIPSWVARSYRA